MNDCTCHFQTRPDTRRPQGTSWLKKKVALDELIECNEISLFAFIPPSVQMCLYVSTLTSVICSGWFQHRHVHQWMCHLHFHWLCARGNMVFFFTRTARSSVKYNGSSWISWHGKWIDEDCDTHQLWTEITADFKNVSNSPFGPYLSKLTLTCSRVSPVFSFTPKLSKTSVADLVCAFSILVDWA